MAIPPKEQMTGNNTTEAQFKSGMNSIVDYLGDVDKQSLNFGTTAELKLIKPNIGQKAKTLDNGKVWEWDGSKWGDTGEGELDRANEFTVELNEATNQSLNDLNIFPGVNEAGIEFGVSDLAGNTAFSVTKSAVAVAKEFNAEKLSTTKSEITDIDSSEFEFAVVDSDGNVAFGVRSDSSIFPELKSEPVKLPPNIKIKKTDWMHGNTYGQSLSRGSGSYPIVSAVQPFKNITFTSGVSPRQSDPHDYSGTKPLIEERWNPAGSEGESPTSGMLNKISELALLNGEDLVFFGASSGQGGTSLKNLSKGTKRYDEQLFMYQSAYDLAQDRDLSYSVAFIGFVQGESNYNANTSRSDYKDLEVQLKRDFDADIQEITNQDFVPVMVTYQTASHHVASTRRDHVNIALAQLDAHRENIDIVMACSMYSIEYLKDNLHLTADSSQQLGKYLGKAAHHMWRYVHDQESRPFQPLEPKHVLWQGIVIDIEFNVPIGDLTLDTELVRETFNHGFDVWLDDVVQEDAIKSVAIVDKNRVRIVLSQSYESAILSYARGRPSEPVASGPINGPRGNIRDQAGDTDNYIDSKGVTRYMHNWCVIFQYSQTTGFN